MPFRLKTVYCIAFIAISASLATSIFIIEQAVFTQTTDTNYLLIIFTLFSWSVLFSVLYFLLRERRHVNRLRFNTDRLETLLQNLPGMAYRCLNKKNWPMEFVSEGCFTLCGYDRRELEEQSVLWGEFTHPDEIEHVEKTIKSAVDNDRPFEVEYRIISRDGKEKWVWERGRVVDSIEGELILEGFITDITDRKLAETALVEAEAFSKAVVDTAVEAVITVDDSGCIETFNHAAQQMFNYMAEEVKGEYILILISEPDHEEYEEFIAEYLQTKESRLVGMGREVVGKRKDGSKFPIHLSISEVLNQSERKYVGLIRDLSTQRAAEKELREQREQLAHVDRLNTLGEMATGIAHEINQPLTAISMYAQSGLRLLKSDELKSDRLIAALEKLSVQAHRAGAVIERMQQLGKQHETEQAEVNCTSLIRDVYKLAEIEAHIRNMTITLKLAEKLPAIVCDPVQIQQVLLNLLRNGMESMKSIDCRNGNQIILKAASNKDSNGVEILIIDTGTGVSDDYIEQIFQPFSSTKDTGVGLGLSISRSIIKAHGGQLEFQNNSNGGATFYFTLPDTRAT